MAKYKVFLQQYVEMTAEVEVEAASSEAARTEAENLARFADERVKWGPGDDAYKVETYAVHDDTGPVWER